MKMIRVLTRESRIVLVNPEAVDAVVHDDEKRCHVLILRSGSRVELRDDYRGMFLDHLYAEPAYMLGAEVVSMEPNDLFAERERRMEKKK